MLWEVIKFELKYRLNRPATYIYFAIWFLFAYLAVCSGVLHVGADIGKVKQNASLTLFNIAAIFSLIPGMFITSAVMGVPILRDFEHKIESLIFTTNITKTSYLLGRFIGSFIILAFISTSFVFGTYLGCIMPWVDHSKFLPVTLAQSLWPWLIMIVFNLFICSCLFFASGALTRKMLFVYLQAIILLALYIGIGSFIGDVENIKKAAILDPFGIYTLDAVTRYWTVAEKNNLLVPFSGLLLLNRVLWLVVGLIFFAITFAVFKFRAVYTGLFKKKAIKSGTGIVADDISIPFANPSYTLVTWFQQVRALTRLYFKEVIRSVPFIGIAIVGLVLIGIDAEYGTSWYGQSLYPVTSIIGGYVAAEVGIILSIMILFYTGEVMWKETQIQFNQIYDSLPTSYAVPVVSKFLALAGIILVYVLFMIPVGMMLQLFKGYTDFQLDVYLKIMLLRLYVPMLIYIAMAVFVQSLFTNKFIGYAVCILFYVYILFAGQMKIFYALFIPNSGGVGVYSDMNGFAADFEKFIVLKVFWAGIAGILLVVSVLFYQRGTDNAYRSRINNALQRFRLPQRVFLTLSVVTVIAAGGYYYVNTKIWNLYINPDAKKDLQANYEKTLKNLYGKLAQPSVVNIRCGIDLSPKTGNLGLNAVITYKNLMTAPISLLLVQEPTDTLVNSHLYF
ncbi:MAG: hypothetical protein ABI203_02100, partial [Mucilaginibacter sp.]